MNAVSRVVTYALTFLAGIALGAIWLDFNLNF